MPVKHDLRGWRVNVHESPTFTTRKLPSTSQAARMKSMRLKS
jgi:hypothetical protein